MRLQKIIFATLVMFLSSNLYGMDLGYPELQVVPSAEDRLKLAHQEKNRDGFFMRNWQMTVPATALMLSGFALNGDQDWEKNYVGASAADIQSKKDDVERAALLQSVVGAAWLGLAFYMDSRDHYKKSYEAVTKMPKKSKMQRLARARMAEEALYDRYQQMRKLKWILGISTIALASQEDNSGGKTAKSVSTIALISGVVPMLFKHRYETNYLNYEKYKKRIYGPIAEARVFVSSDRKIVPGIGLNFRF